MTSHVHNTPAAMSLDAEWRKMADRVRNWGRWGADDELGTLNFITPEVLRHAATLVRRGNAISCGVPINAQGPQGAYGIRRNPIHIMTLDGGDADAILNLPAGSGGPTQDLIRQLYQSGPGRFTDDYIIMPLQSGTQWDALAHFYYEDKLYNGFPAKSVTSMGAAKASIEPASNRGQVVGRGVLLDVARHRGVEHLQANEIITPTELDEVVASQRVEIRQGDIVAIRTGCYLEFLAKGDGEAWAWSAPGLSWRCAEWFHEHDVAAVAADNLAVEVTRPEDGIWSLFHMLALRDMGMLLGELWNLEALGADCAADQVYEFLLVAPALNLSGAVGTPVNPVAIE
jgi:kynurenine formamidase